MSSHRRRMDRLNSTMNETYVNEHDRTENCVIDRDTLKQLIEMKQLVQSNNALVVEQFIKLEKRQDNEINILKQQLKSKDTKLVKLKAELDGYRDREIELRAQNKLLRQDISGLKLELDQQSLLLKNQKDLDAKYHSLESKLQNIMNKLKYCDNSNNSNVDETRLEDDATLNISHTDNSHDTLVDDVELLDDDTSGYGRNDNRNREQDVVRNDEQTHAKPLYSDALRKSEGPRSEMREKHDIDEGTRSKGHKQGQNYQRSDSVFKGMIRRRSQRIVLYNVDATENIDTVVHALIEYAGENVVKVTSTRLLKEYTFRHGSTYMISVNLDSRYFHKIDNNADFWPDGITWRKWIPRSQRDNRYDTDGAYGQDDYRDDAEYDIREHDDWEYSDRKSSNDNSWQ